MKTISGLWPDTSDETQGDTQDARPNMAALLERSGAVPRINQIVAENEAEKEQARRRAEEQTRRAAEMAARWAAAPRATAGYD